MVKTVYGLAGSSSKGNNENVHININITLPQYYW